MTEIPTGISLSMIAGIPSQYGLYSGIMGGITYVIFGGCKDINVGPTSLMSVFVRSKVAVMGPQGALAITLLSGISILMAGILRLGFLVDFFSFPVASGFTTAAAISIATSQLRQLFGITGTSPDGFIDEWKSFIGDIGKVRMWDSLLGCASVLFLIGLRELRKFGSLKNKPEWSKNRNILSKVIFYFCLSGNALAVITGISIAYIAEQYYNSTPLILAGQVDGGLPTFSLPPFSITWNNTYFNFSDILSEYGSLLVFCPLIAILEHIAIVKAFSKGKLVDPTQEMLALGIANVTSSFVQSMPVTGSFTRSTVNNASGVRTTMAGLITSCGIIIALALFSGIFKYIPKTTLAAVIIVAMFYLCHLSVIGVLWRTKKLDLIPFFVAVISCLLLSLEYGIIIGTGANLLFVLYESARPKLYFDKTFIRDQMVYLVCLKGSLHFPSAEYIRYKILKQCQEEKSTVIVDGEFVRTMDATTANSFKHLLEDFEVRNIKLMFWNFNKSVTDICTGDNKVLIEHFKNGALEDLVEEYRSFNNDNNGCSHFSTVIQTRTRFKYELLHYHCL
ncbi:hypothetical protein ABEB36_001546 [Hypothenemus hampei]|uniref:STAS domain-containing protein n=1 Tax=Hypothenemus hampei TaxID=57062 RepID=A0ABD1FEX6_HYPHA